MHDRKLWSVLVPAAGTGERIGRGPKAHLTIGGASFLAHVMRAAAGIADEILVAMPATGTPRLSVGGACRVVAGGETRQETVRKLLDRSRGEWLLLHDVARPLCSGGLMLRVAEIARDTGVAVAVGPVDVPMAILEGDLVVRSHRATDVGLAQTPLALHRDILAAAYAKADRDGVQAPSTLELVLATGARVRAVPGERANFKITTAEDLRVAEALASGPR